MTCDSVDLPEPFGPMIACTSPLFTLSDSPWRISRSSTRTCRSFTSSNGILVSQTFGGAVRAKSTDRSLQRDRNQLLRLDRELHRQLLQHVLDETVDDEAD